MRVLRNIGYFLAAVASLSALAITALAIMFAGFIFSIIGLISKMMLLLALIAAAFKASDERRD